MTSNITHAGIFLIDTLFSILLFVILMRILLQWVHADYYNPIVQALVRLSNPLLTPFRSALPNRGRVDWAAVVLLLLIQIINSSIIILLAGAQISVVLLLVSTLAKLLRLVIYTFIFAIIIRAVLSFVGSNPGNPVQPLLYQLTEPLMAPVRRLLPAMGGLDLSPLVVIVLLQLVLILLGIG